MATQVKRTDTQYRIMVFIDSDLPVPDQMRVGESLYVELYDGRVIHVPAGFITDCHSTPRITAALLPEYDNRTNLAAIVHDYLYMHWGVVSDEFNRTDRPSVWLDYPEYSDRRYCDEVYYELMNRFLPGHWRNRLYYVAVRTFGFWNWNKYRARESAAGSLTV